jgi:hypothetical protein
MSHGITRTSPGTLKEQICVTLAAFVSQRPGMNSYDFEPKGYRAARRSIQKDKRDALALLAFVKSDETITADHILNAAKEAYSGRLEITPPLQIRERGCLASSSPGVMIDYTPGQYAPGELREAAAAVLARVLWDRLRLECPKDEEHVGDWIHARAVERYGKSLARTWLKK